MRNDDDKNRPSGLLPKAYDDLLHPSAAQIGATVARAISMSLSPVNGVLWSAEKALSWVQQEVSRRLRERDVPIDRIEPPAPALVGAVVIGLQVSAGDRSLQSMYANLLASGMDSFTSASVHPAFAELIRQLLPDEARILQHLKRTSNHRRIFACEAVDVSDDLLAVGVWRRNVGTLLQVCQAPHQIVLYTINLQRLGLVRSHECSLSVTNKQVVAMNFRHILDDDDEHLVREALSIWKPGQLHWDKNISATFLSLSEMGGMLMSACSDVIATPPSELPADHSAPPES